MIPKSRCWTHQTFAAVILRSLTHFSGHIESIIGIRAREWLFCRLRSGFGIERYITRNIGQNHSITYESSVQMEVTVAVRGRLMQTAASVCVFRLWLGTLNRQMCPGEQCFLLPPRFISPTPSVAPPRPSFSPAPRNSVSDISHSKIPLWRRCHTLMLPLPHLLELWQGDRQAHA